MGWQLDSFQVPSLGPEPIVLESAQPVVVGSESQPLLQLLSGPEMAAIDSCWEQLLSRNAFSFFGKNPFFSSYNQFFF